MLTEQQQAVVDAAVTGTNLVVEAGAGTGKTTTMVSVAEALAPKRMIYTAFTRAMVDEAGMKMLHLPSVSCLTIHQIAFRASAFPFRDRLNAKGIWWNRVAGKVLTHLDLGTLPDARGELLRLDAKWVHLIARDAVANYMQSDDWEITEWHISIPRTIPRDYWDQLKSRILPIAREVWDDYTNPDGQLPFVHDIYLKLYQLAERRSPTLHRTYDVAIIDEAQDVSDVMLSIFDSQPDTMQKIVVGDSAQAIFCQPVGTTKVLTSTFATRAPEDRQCCVDGCTRYRNHTTGDVAGMCHQHACMVRRGVAPQAIPITRPVLVEVPIEDVQVGDQVASYGIDKRYFSVMGDTVAAATRSRYLGDLVRVETASGLSSEYTLEHHTLVRLPTEGHVVYLMRSGDHWRIGKVPWKYGSAQALGPVMRAKAEGADEMWILSQHDTDAEARIAEAVAQQKFNIPSMIFKANNKSIMDVASFWAKVGDMNSQGAACLAAYGRLRQFPLWTSTMRVGLRRPIITAAANLMTGMRVLPVHAMLDRSERYDRHWEPVTVSRRHYDGDVVSLAVNRRHTYAADGIVTHNCWNGAKNSLAQFRGQGWPMLPLTNSFRFGPAVADAANAVLDRMPGMELRIVGAGAYASEIIEYDDPTRVPNAVLCRTNASVIEQTIRYVALGLKVSAVVDTVKLQKWARAAKDLMAARPTDFVELAAFRNWRQAVDFSKTDLADPDFVGMVKLLEKHGPATLESIDDMCVPESQAEVVVITGHKAKGREWDHVKVAEDFTDGRLGGPGVVNSKGEPVPVNLEEHRLFYVALTRCRKTVDVSESTAFDLFSGGMPLVPVSGPLGL